MGDDSPYSKGGSAAWAKRNRPQSSKSSLSYLVVPRLVYESAGYDEQPKLSKIKHFANENKKSTTLAENRFRYIITNLNGGILRGKFKEQHIISGKWIADFYFPEIRLVVEIDGSIRFTAKQVIKDRLKDADCERFDITVVRITNAEVFGNRELLIRKLRSAWRRAKNRENNIIGTQRPI